MENMQSNQNLITVIVPVYNTRPYLVRCVESLCKQTYQNIEILLVNDGSTDGSGLLCDGLASEDSRIRVIHKKNGGSSSARNMAIDQAKGDFIGFVDSDDYVEPDMFEKLLEAFERHPEAGITQVGRDEIDEQGNMLPDICIPPEEEEIWSSEDFIRELLMHRGDCSLCTKLVRRELFEDPANRFPIGLLNEDFRILLRLLAICDGVISLPGHLYHVFYRLGSNSRKKTKDEFSRVYGDCVDNADLAQQLVKAFYPNLNAVAFRFGVFQRLEYLLHIPVAQMTKDNEQYTKIVSWMRKYWFKSVNNRYLTKKNKLYHTLFAIAPRKVREVHKKYRLKEK